MNLSLFDYEFPKELVAQHPLTKRDDSKLMVVHRTEKTWEHRYFPDLISYLKSGDLLVLNNASADLIEFDGKKVPPLPPYIKRKKIEHFTEEDFERYRTVYARVPGSKAAPTAGFHFTDEVLEQIQNKGVEIKFITLTVDYDTYKPIRTPNILDHPMHGEFYEIPEETQASILRAKKEGRRVIAVGTTSVRALESWVNVRVPLGAPHLQGAASSAPTRLFIHPGYKFQIVDALLTNFHRPRSTVLVMVSAFAGRELIVSAYQEAIREKYRLFSYGDCMLIL